MYAARRRLLEILRGAVWSAHLKETMYDPRDDTAPEAYYAAREMAHWARKAMR
jgi:hypothetical protein